MGNRIVIVLAMVLLCALAYRAGYESGFASGCKEMEAVALDAIREVKEAGLKAMQELVGAP